MYESICDESITNNCKSILWYCTQKFKNVVRIFVYKPKFVGKIEISKDLSSLIYLLSSL
jgi:hypothetical protein